MTAMAKTHKENNKSFKRNKNKSVKYAKGGKKEFKPIGKRGRLIVRNLPFQTNEKELQKHFISYGKIKEVHLLRRPNNKLVGCGFVEFNSRLNADKAIEELNGKPFLGRPIYIDRAVSRERYDEHSKEGENEEEISEDSSGQVQDNNLFKDETEMKDEPMSDDDDHDVHMTVPEIKKEELSSDEEGESKEEEKQKILSQNTEMDQKHLKNMKKGRLIVRNLSFKSTEEKLKSHFAQFGEVTEVTLLKRPDNTLVGCGFVQFSKKLSAAKAIHHTSGKPFLGRPIIVDWAITKDRFKKLQEESIKKEIKKEDISDEETKPVDLSSVSVKTEKNIDEESDEESEEESESSDSEKDGNTDEEEESDDNEEDEKPKIKEEVDQSKKQRIDDVDEGKTVFVKNLPFSVDDKEFKSCMEQFGPVFYALVCKDKFTEHSRGSGFVKFKNKDDADKCLSAGTELSLKGNILDPHPALKRNEAQQLKDKKPDKKDNRNLYLVKEGLIIAGTPAARGVSVTDMDRRLQLEQWKTTKLRNLNMFVSRNRLVIHNLTPTFNDKQLKKLFKKHAGPKAFIKEARVMRDLKQVDTKGKGLTKGYGFVSFEKHEDALKALRSINNNPNVFTSAARPIVAFSIENRSVLNTKRKRMERSQQKNPLCKSYKPEKIEQDVKKDNITRGIKQGSENEPEYAGIIAKPGATVKMRQKYKLKNQAEQHLQYVKKQKRDMKLSRNMRRTEHIKKKQGEKKMKKKNKTSSDNDTVFSKLIDKYKSKLLSYPIEKKKWYDE